LASILDSVIEQALKPEATFKDLTRAAQLDSSVDFVGADLTDLDFRNDDLTDFNFSFANLTGCDFRGARTKGTIFEGANLTGAIGLFDRADAEESKPEYVDIPSLLFASARAPSVRSVNMKISCDSSFSGLILQYKQPLQFLFRRMIEFLDAEGQRQNVGNYTIGVEIYKVEQVDPRAVLLFILRSTESKPGALVRSVISAFFRRRSRASPFEDHRVSRLLSELGGSYRLSPLTFVEETHLRLEIPSLDRYLARSRNFGYLRAGDFYSVDDPASRAK
jgi:hypothetical protein